MRTLDEQVDEIRSRNDFTAFARALLKNLREHPEQWENNDLISYLDALSAWVEDMDGYYINRGEPVPEVSNWRVLGQMLLAARIYE
jgi:hypothetical protein